MVYRGSLALTMSNAELAVLNQFSYQIFNQSRDPNNLMKIVSRGEVYITISQRLINKIVP